MTTSLLIDGRLRSADSLRAAVRTANQDLRQAADRLVEQHTDLPPGSVLRCFSTSVRTLLLAGRPFPEVVTEAERLTRQKLEHRSLHDWHRRAALGAGEPRVPRPRRPR